MSCSAIDKTKKARNSEVMSRREAAQATLRTLLFALALSLAASPALGSSYKEQFLQVTGAPEWSEALAINDAGDIVGAWQAGSGADAILWSPNGNPTVLASVGGF